MLCERYKETLIDAIASGAPIPAEAQMHLRACPSCRALLEREHSLFAAIDTGVRQIANAEVPPSLLPVLRVRLAQESSSTSSSATVLHWIWAYAAAAVLLVTIPFLLRRTVGPAPTGQREPQHFDSAQKTAPPQYSATRDPVGQLAARKPEVHASPERQPHHDDAQVLIAPEERAALLQLASNFSQNKELVEGLQKSPQAGGDGMLTIEPLQIARLEIKPLEAEEGPSSDR
jgi:hypothetical protein